MQKGLMGNKMALGYSDAEDRALAPGETDSDNMPRADRMKAAAMPPGPHAMPNGSQIGGAEQEIQDDQFDEALERVQQAALMALRTPEVQQQLAEIGADGGDTAEAIASVANSLLDGLDEKSGESIPEDVLPPAALAIVGMIGTAIDADQQTVGRAADLLMRMAARDAGMSDDEIETEMAAAAQQEA